MILRNLHKLFGKFAYEIKIEITFCKYLFQINYMKMIKIK